MVDWKNPEQVREYKRKFYLKNKRKILAARRAYYYANRETAIEKSVEWNKRNRLRRNHKGRIRYRANRDHYLAKAQNYNEANRTKINERSKKWVARNKKKRRIISQRTRFKAKYGEFWFAAMAAWETRKFLNNLRGPYGIER